MNDELSDIIFEKPFAYRLNKDCLQRGGVQRIYTFENGFGASVIKGPMSFGGSRGLWELAVLHNKRICYKTPITDDVVGYLTDAERDDLLERISLLPKADHNEQCGRMSKERFDE